MTTINFIKVYLKRSASYIPLPVRNIMKKFGLKRLWEKFIGKYADELNFQYNWANAYNGKSENLKEALILLWKKFRCLDDILKICKIDQESKILDVGCGIATVLHILEGKKYGIDPLGEEYKKIYKYPEDLKIRSGLAEKIPFKEEMFNVVFCSNALDHTTNPEKALKEIKRVLVKGGYFVLVVEIKEKEIKRDIKHPHTFTMQHLQKLLSTFSGEMVFEKLMPWHGGNSKGYIAILKKR
jgi:ubiquinone/menaquinone biosynthesis C-methylase UbiE